MALPSNVSFGTVIGTFLLASADSPADPDRDPEGNAATDLTFTFAPDLSPAAARDASASPPTMFALLPVSATVGQDGSLLGPDGAPGVRLVASTNPALQPTGWTWRVTLKSNTFPAMSFSFLLDPAATVDLATVLQVPPNPGGTLNAWLQAVADALAARDAAVAAAASVPSRAELATTYSTRRAAVQASQRRTLPDGTTRFATATPPAFSDVTTLPTANLPVYVQPDKVFQEILGFGAALSDSAAYLLMTKLDFGQRQALLTELFHPDQGGWSQVRIGFGGMDFATTDFWSYDTGYTGDINAATLAGATSLTIKEPRTLGDYGRITNLPVGTKLRVGQDDLTLGEIVTTTGAVTTAGAGSPYTIPVTAMINAHPATAKISEVDTTLGNFKVTREFGYLIPLLREILAINPRLRVHASMWSNPQWMRTSQRYDRGYLWPDAKQALANYLVKSVQAFQSAGVPIYSACVQNEPWADGVSFVYISPTDYIDLMKTYVGPAFDAAGLTTFVLGHDHHFNTGTSLLTVAADPDARANMGVIGWHAYGGNANNVKNFTRRYPAHLHFMTEFRTLLTEDWARSLELMVGDALIGFLRSGGSGICLWNLALDPTGKPNKSADGRRGVVQITTDGLGTVTRESVEYWMLKHAAAAFQPGSRRIESTTYSFGSAGTDVQTTAALNPDGSIALLMWNASTVARSVNVIDTRTGQGFPVALAVDELTTVTWGLAGAVPIVTNARAALTRTARTKTPAVVGTPATAAGDSTNGRIQTFDFTVTVPTNNDQMLVVAIEGGVNQGNTVTADPFSVDVDGVPIRMLDFVSAESASGITQGNIRTVGVFYQLNPSPGTRTIRVRTTTPTFPSALAFVVKDVDAQEPWSTARLATVGSGTSVTTTLPTPATTDLPLSFVASSSNNTQPSTTGTAIAAANGGNFNLLRADRPVDANVAYTGAITRAFALVAALVHGAA